MRRFFGYELRSWAHDDFEFASRVSGTLSFGRISLATQPAKWVAGGPMSNKRANEIHALFSARNREIFAGLTRKLFNAFEAGATVQQLSRQYGLPVERVHTILKDETRNRGAEQPASRRR